MYQMFQSSKPSTTGGSKWTFSYIFTYFYICWFHSCWTNSKILCLQNILRLEDLLSLEEKARKRQEELDAATTKFQRYITEASTACNFKITTMNDARNFELLLPHARAWSSDVQLKKLKLAVENKTRAMVEEAVAAHNRAGQGHVRIIYPPN